MCRPKVRRSATNVRTTKAGCDHQEQDERDAAVAVADHDDEDRGGRDDDDLRDEEPRVTDRDAVTPMGDEGPHDAR